MHKIIQYAWIAALTMATTSNLLAQYPAHKLPAYRTQHEIQLMLNNRKLTPNGGFGKTGVVMPGKVRYPGEFEESQAVCISWNYEYDNNWNVIGVDTSTEYGYISAQLTKYISDELPVWIRITTAADSTKILAKMANLGWPLTNNYHFMITPGDDWWMRDFGPNGIYWGDADSLAFVDVKYYDGRDLDNDFPKAVASYLGVRNIVSALNAEGGNLMSDGFGRVFLSDVVDEANEFILGWDSTQTIDTLSALFGATYPINLKQLKCDGGTGHIDLYTKLVDEQTLFVMEYPSIITATDKKIIEDNYQYLTTLRTTYNRPFRIIRFPMPTGDNGTYNLKSCSQINSDARTYINGITLNKTFIYPSYSDSVTGNQAQTAEATALFQKHMPGYKVIPIDARAASPGGGSIHCITMQIPADNPVLFWHPTIDGFAAIQTSYAIEAKITNRSGIASAVCKWRLRNTGTWNTVSLAADAQGVFRGTIIPGALTINDTLDYFLEAVTNNGKTAVKPITAPEGYYTLQFKGYSTGLTNELITAKNHLFAPFPNPATDELTLTYQTLTKSNSTFSITDITGKEVLLVTKPTTFAGLQSQVIDVRGLNSGLYFCTLILNGERIDTRKFIIKH